MKLIYYEYRKILSKKLFVVFVVVLFMMNLVLFVKEQYDSNKMFLQYKETYSVFEDKYKSQNVTEVLDEISSKENIFFISDQINGSVAKITDQSLREENKKQLEKTNLEAVRTYENSIYYNNDEYIRRDEYILGEIKKQCMSINNYHEYILSIEPKAKEMIKNPMFNKTNTFAYRNILKTVEDFKGLESIKLELGNEKGILAITDYHIVDILVIIILFLLCYYLFVEEREKGLIELLKANKKGRRPVVIAKLILLQATTIGMTLLFYLPLLILSEQMYGYGNLPRAVQSMSTFRECEFFFSVGVFLVIFLLTKMIAMLLMSVIIGSIFAVLDSTNKMYICTILFLVISYLLYSFIHPVSYFNVLKYTNVFSLLNVFDLYCHYTNINLFGFPFSKQEVLFSIAIICYISCMITIYVVFVYRETRKDIGSGRRLISIIPKKHTCLFIHELYKSVIANKGYIVIIIALGMGYYTIDQTELLFDYDTSVYNEYVNQLAGKLNDDKAEFIKNETMKFENIPKNIRHLNDNLDEGKITISEWNQEIQIMSAFASKSKGFKKIKNQYLYLEGLYAKGIEGSFIHQATSDYMFDNKVRDLVRGIVCSILMTLCVGGVFANDYVNNIYSIIKCSRNGRLRLCTYKHIMGYLYTILLVFIFYTPYFINLFMKYPHIDWQAPIQSIVLMEGVNLSISVRSFVLLTGIIQIIGSLMMATVIMTISQVVKKQFTTVCIATVIFIVPLILQLAGVSFIQYMSFNNTFTPYALFMNQSHWMNRYIYITVIVVIGVLHSWLGMSLYCKNGITWRLRAK